MNPWAAGKPCPKQDIFDLEYWVLEQAKLGKQGPGKPHQGKIALVSGACGGIGKACCDALAADGATVVGLDINPDVSDVLATDGMTGLVCDLTDDSAIQSAIEQVVATFGGLDILVCNAGMFKTGERVEAHTTATWDQTLAINLTATQRLMTAAIPFLQLGIDPSILVVGSRKLCRTRARRCRLFR